jgi:hypothetical protein
VVRGGLLEVLMNTSPEPPQTLANPTATSVVERSQTLMSVTCTSAEKAMQVSPFVVSVGSSMEQEKGTGRQ